MPKKKRTGVRLSDDKINEILDGIDAGSTTAEAVRKKRGVGLDTIKKWQKRREAEGVYISRKPGRQPLRKKRATKTSAPKRSVVAPRSAVAPRKGASRRRRRAEPTPKIFSKELVTALSDGARDAGDDENALDSAKSRIRLLQEENAKLKAVIRMFLDVDE